MLSIVNINNQTDVSVYSVPQGKRALVFVDINPVVSPSSLTIKINNYVFYNGLISNNLSIKLVLTSNDNITVSSTGQVNVFVHGLEL